MIGVAPAGFFGQPGEDHVRRARRGERRGHGGGHRQHRTHPLVLGNGPTRFGSGRWGRRIAKQRLDHRCGGARMRLDVIGRAEHRHLLAIRFRPPRLIVGGDGRGISRLAQRDALAVGAQYHDLFAGRRRRRRPGCLIAGPLPRPGCASSSPNWLPTASSPGCAPARRSPGRRDSPPPRPDSSPAADTSTGPRASPIAHPAAPPQCVPLSRVP